MFSLHSLFCVHGLIDKRIGNRLSDVVHFSAVYSKQNFKSHTYDLKKDDDDVAFVVFMTAL